MFRLLSLCLMLASASSGGVDESKHANLERTGLKSAGSTKTGQSLSAQIQAAAANSHSEAKTALRGTSRSIIVQPTNQTGIMIAPFGKEDTARELQGNAARTQDTLVDAIENAEVAEIKRSVFRALTRLRAAEIKEFDTIARLETQALDEYNDNHHYRGENPLQYISSAEPRVPEDKYISFHD
mmetsp:Transcript_136536/g.262284  ORF Transcript_136536/g.262284 Transcript_136536/m.262284 type:complete len:183 (+) Transcript_136536:101-649(+)